MTDILNVKVNGEWVAIPAIKGENGEGVPTGGTTGQALVKKSNTDYDTEFKTLSATDVGAYPDTNPSGYTSNIGTVTSVNNVSPVSGNVTIPVGDTLPSQTGNANKVLGTNGTAPSWVEQYSRNIGETVKSKIPLTDAGLHLLDGALISGSGIYADFVTDIADLATDYPNLFTTEANWQASVTNYGACDKFVYDNVNNTVRLPKRTVTHGDLIKSYNSGTDWYRIYSDGWCEQGGYIAYTTDYAMLTINFFKPFINTNYDFSRTWHSTYTTSAQAQCSMLGYNTKSTNSITIQSSVSPYGAGSDWRACGYIDISDYQYSPIYEYIVVATTTKTQIQVDIDEIATDLNGKADVDLTNINNTGKTAIAHNAMPSDTYETLTILSSGSEYTAPADGWFSVVPNGGALGTGQWISLYYPNALFGSGLNYAGGGTVSSFITLEAKKGQKVVFLYGNITSANLNLVFYYAQGSESEAS